MTQNRTAEARQEFQLAIEHGQDYAEIASAYHNLGITMLQQHELAHSIDMFSEALRLVANKQESYLARGMAEFRLNNFGTAE